MPQCTICTHPDREPIDHDLVGGKSLRSVAQRFGVSHSALHRHKRDHIPADLARAARLSAEVQARQDADLARTDRLAEQVRARDAAAAAHAIDLLAELHRTFERVRKLFDACDRWLADPDDPTRYDLGPRADEVLVHYTVPGPGGVPTPARAPLSALLAQAGLAHTPTPPPDPAADPDGLWPVSDRATAALTLTRIELRHADPRELILKTARRLEAELQLIARLVGQLSDPAPQQTVNVLVASPEWVATRAAILRALEPYPDARAAVAEAMRHAAVSE